MRLLSPVLLLLLCGSASGDETPARSESAKSEGPGAAASSDENESGDSKKARHLAEKAARPAVRAESPESTSASERLTLRNLWTHEIIAVAPDEPPTREALAEMLRDHFTNQSTTMDPRLGEVIVKAAGRFKSRVVDIVSGYRAPKYNLMLRKKGRAVARDSQHPQGHAVDFRLAGVNTRQLFQFVRSLRLGGVGYYPHTAFVHADVGPIRTWKGE